MAKQTRSFFGKIMGGDAEEQPVEVHHVETEEVYEEPEAEIDAEELGEDETDEIDMETEIAAVEYEAEAEEEEEEPAQPVQAPNQEWLSDYEGQLNIDMYQTRDNVIIKSTIAGVRPEDIDITVANDMVTVKGARRKEENIPAEDYFYQECYWGSFTRSVIVPVDIDSENIEADLKDGILTIVVPKAAKAKTKKVKVKGL
jgi:HSP20 family protein